MNRDGFWLNLKKYVLKATQTHYIVCWSLSHMCNLFSILAKNSTIKLCTESHIKFTTPTLSLFYWRNYICIFSFVFGLTLSGSGPSSSLGSFRMPSSFISSASFCSSSFSPASIWTSVCLILGLLQFTLIMWVMRENKVALFSVITI